MVVKTTRCTTRVCSNNGVKSLHQWFECNGKHIAVKGKGTIAIPTCHGTKLITYVLYVPDIDQNLLRVSQLVEKGYKVLFNNDCYLIKDENDSD